ncbi:16S rRNA (cytosine(1402)-N(4))-methyltransferase [Candidatus Berkelbacteria bacterium CG_4_8_14_3_um_filter_33_6]|uniref:Ribosomal RNA small subunit methyltransferase H n=1 Tax=Candidatus Berkelbacteria bacterium CG_4_10_14_0_2_um_filter_35_9_33_12 TaxID=1974499 RepID=A0A2M7W4S5_9BACT|nr:MAG: 16S rRNA (cytosine(1402)-N(4))-methyltransferase [Candidatus Berkelbacteria bacterium CG23_combo_of_CG06-09_8_20_14_all_33_15]PIS08260.1 MAG: 16S rRNA (cytosine(1402)-N(4))-methyltransferase [Candidatus Berkelbacteria bacterium CG10_big_fil_rev_8_21_14_0_10_33_10]PIX31339.1 MAG: 16S rRNA (cytosine(1402)-N(4))-methyltransferase [Candidatus Berkelbacteria bacterium CG_4_8_14_3_um_filter_33_6]PIZ28110.1 MAG: 16S rRNA (cytosine(1402)-N(4))-methyltransferase [Candidatus Berkelbacteria bacteri
MQHTPVLVKEIAEIFSKNLSNGSVFIDGTVGLAGHTIELANYFDRQKKKATIIGVDQDVKMLALALENVRKNKTNCEIYLKKENYAELYLVLKNYQLIGVDGVLLDLGVNSAQFDDLTRGFSFNAEKLDMRFDESKKLTAHTIVNFYSEKELGNILAKFGEVKGAYGIAKKIVEDRPIKTTFELKRLLEQNYQTRKGKINPATLVFQALRIEVNSELKNLENFLKSINNILNTGGIVAIISFHSLEDRLVKNYFYQLVESGEFKYLKNKLIVPSAEEIAQNLRARSAKLRVIKKY